MNAYILIGGRSTRMGTEKASIDLAGRTILDRVASIAAEAFDAVFAVQRSSGEDAFAVPTIREPEHDGTAPVWGVRTALEHAGSKCFVLAVDYPLLTAGLLSHLRDRFAAAPSRMLVPMWNDRAQTLCAGYDAALLPLLRTRMEGGRFDLRGLVDEAGAIVIPEAELRARFTGEPLMNVNTPEELAAARRQFDETRC
jgi:molybdopterin-guanine dinucleotide biosynthesis protein A